MSIMQGIFRSCSSVSSTTCLHSAHVVAARNICTSSPLSHLQLLSRVRVVDNSSLGAAAAANKPARVIHVYNKTHVGRIGDKVLLAIMGQKKKALIVGVKQYGHRMTPKFDTNNVILLEDTGNPTGTRITVPIPSHLRKREDLAKVFAIATKFV